MPVARSNGASLAAKVAERIRGEFLDIEGRPVKFLPSERDLSGRMGCARTTVRGALGLLAEEGLVRAEQGRGYRVLPRVLGVRAGTSVAVVMPESWLTEDGSSNQSGAALAMQRVLLDGGYRALIMSVDWKSPQKAARQLEEVDCWGAVLVGGELEAYKAIARTGLPCVAIDFPNHSLPIDTIMQDNFGGGRLAAEYLLARGHQQIAWFGPIAESDHALERFAGARTAFTARGLDFPRKWVFSKAWDEAAVRKVLSRPDRPRAVLSMWVGMTLTVGKVARELGLKLGRDLEMVGWSTEARYRTDMAREFGDGKVPPIVVWSTDELAHVAMSRLLWHQREPNLKPLRVSVPMRLVTGPEDF
jgi:GntR family transcriptional regulator, arabinose operon transcriptional repressor